MATYGPFILWISTLHILLLLLCSTALCSWFYYYPHLTDEETSRGKLNDLQSITQLTSVPTGGQLRSLSPMSFCLNMTPYCLFTTKRWKKEKHGSYPQEKRALEGEKQAFITGCNNYTGINHEFSGKKVETWGSAGNRILWEETIDSTLGDSSRGT